MAKTGRELFNKLTTAQKIKFKTNLLKYYESRAGIWKKYMDNSFNDGSFLYGAFSWVDTKQGFKYWNNVQSKIEK